MCVRCCYLGKGLYKPLSAFVPIHLYVYKYNKMFKQNIVEKTDNGERGMNPVSVTFINPRK